jgi:hypothetical protein
MTQANTLDFPRDDNLRLILAGGHEDWLHERISTTRRRTVLVLAVTALAVALLGGILAYWFAWRGADTVPTELVVVTTLAMVTVLIGGVYGSQSFRRLGDYRDSLVDHRDFLRRYNRI